MNLNRWQWLGVSALLVPMVLLQPGAQTAPAASGAAPPAAEKKLERLLPTDHNSYVQSVALSADGKQVVTGSLDSTAILWEAATGKKLRTFQGHAAEGRHVPLPADGKHVLTGPSDRTAHIRFTATAR